MYYNSNYYVRIANAVVLYADSDYFQLYSNDPSNPNIWQHHLPKQYLYLAEKCTSNSSKQLYWTSATVYSLQTEFVNYCMKYFFLLAIANASAPHFCRRKVSFLKLSNIKQS